MQTYPRAPAASAASINSGAFATEQITTAHDRRCRAISLVTSMPFNSGILRSRTATEGCNRLICSRADRPLSAVAITSKSRDRAVTSVSRALRLSSATRIRNLILQTSTGVGRIPLLLSCPRMTKVTKHCRTENNLRHSKSIAAYFRNTNMRKHIPILKDKMFGTTFLYSLIGEKD